MIGRRVTALFRQPTPARLPQSLTFQAQYKLPFRTLCLQPRRTYATPGRPRSVVGEPSTAVRRAAKRSAAKVTTSTNSVGKENSEPKNKKKEVKKKGAAKKTGAAEKKGAAKEKGAKKKTAAKKAAVKKPAKKEMTEDQKAAKIARSEKAKIAVLKKAALDPPQNTTRSAYLEFCKERSKGKKVPEGQSAKEGIQAFTKESAAAWKELSVVDIEHYNHLAHKENETSQAEYKRWVGSHTPEQIHDANRARKTLRRKLAVGKDAKEHKRTRRRWPAINDERAAKKPLNAFLQFSTNRQKSGDFKNIAVIERLKLIGQEWKALDEDEKKKYKTLGAEDSKRYAIEFSKVYGQPPPLTNGHQQPAMAAAAA